MPSDHAQCAPKAILEATAAQHFDLPKGKPAQFVRNGILETCQCFDCAALALVPAQGAPVAWAILYQVGGTGIWKIVQDQASADFWKKEGFPVQPLAPTNPPPVITSGLVPDKNSASGFRVGSAVTSTERAPQALAATPAVGGEAKEIKLLAEIKEMYAKLCDGTLHVPYCNGNHSMRVGHPDTICNCTLGQEIKSLRKRAETAEAAAPPASPLRTRESIRKILTNHFWTGEPGQHGAIEAATNILSASPPEQPADPLAKLVSGFSKVLLAKLRLGRANGKSGWERDDWERKCQQDLLAHLEKGDPRDIAAYCAFMWHHNWLTVAPEQPAAPPDTGRLVSGKHALFELRHQLPQMQWLWPIHL